jgi:hypothetical protein
LAGGDRYDELVYDWRRADFDSMSNFLYAVDWHGMVSRNLTADALWTAFDGVLQNAVKQFVPVRKPLRPKLNSSKRHYPKVIRQAIARKRCLWRRHRQNLTDIAAYEIYRAAHKECHKLITDYEIKAEERIINSNNTGAFYRFVNSRLTCKTGIGNLKDKNGNIVVDNQTKANLLNEFFASVGVADNGIDVDLKREVPENVSLDSVTFDPAVILRTIRRLKNKHSN